MLLAWQGWKGRTVFFDLVPHIESAQALVVHGWLPDRGCLSSFASYIPPGTTWLLLPGVFVFQDPRLFEVIGSGLLYLGTLLGIFLLARQCGGRRCALLAVGLYGLSELGLFVAGSLWPRLPLPCFYVWMVYWTGRWIRHQQARSLTAALVMWGAGMYVCLELAPAIFVLPVLWLVYRTPVRRWAVVTAAGVTLLIWAPYLRFEATRGFVDLTSQVLRQAILPVHPQQSWCDPTLTSREWGESARAADATASQSVHASGLTSTDPWQRLLTRGKAILGGLPDNFEHVLHVPGATFGTPVGMVLLLQALSSLTWCSLSESSAAWIDRLWCPWRVPLAVGLLLGSVLANEFVLAWIVQAKGHLAPPTLETLRIWQVVLGLCGLAFWLPSWARMPVQSQQATMQVRVLVLSLLIPWGILLGLAEPDPYPLGPEKRFWWLWPLQVILLAAFVTKILPRLRVPRLYRWVILSLLMVFVLGNPHVLSHMEEWWHSGWAGLDAPEIQVVDYLAGHLRAHGKTQAAVGYQVFFDRFMAEQHAIDPRYKVGADFDLLLKLRHGISNVTQCAEGISRDDEYRILQMYPSERVGYFPLAPESRVHLLQRFGPYQVIKRH
jgi:Dolichyl-phosphate-mannose-protein mannosyltransferase